MPFERPFHLTAVVLTTAIAATLFLQGPPGAAATSAFELSPSTADPTVSGWFTPHLVWEPERQLARDQLVLFLPGSGARPDRAGHFLEQMGELGFHVLGLSYANDRSMASLCNRSPETDCFLDARREVLYGIDASDHVAISEPDSIVRRIERALHHLDDTRPAGGWQVFLRAGGIDWLRVVATGVSQGGGHAVLLGRDHELDRVVMFASPGDYSVFHQQLAPWIADRGGLTPAARHLGFSHLADRWERREEAWSLLGLAPYGPVVVADGVTSWPATRRYVTEVQPRVAGEYHGSVIADDLVPLDASGTPIYADLWRHLVSAPLETGTAGQIEVSASAVEVPETSGTVTLEVRRLGGLQGAVSVDYDWYEGSATAGVDWFANAGTLHWADGESGSQPVRLEVIDDGLAEGLEELQLLLVSSRGDAPITANSTRVTIRDDDTLTPCLGDLETLCLGAEGRFRVQVSWTDFDQQRGKGRVADLQRRDSGLFTFFDPENLELLVKVLDGCPLGGHYWVSIASTTNVAYEILVTDTLSGEQRTYGNPLGQLATPVLDTSAFGNCP